MWPFAKNESIPDMTADVYTSWLRAGKPPFQWFMELHPLQQEKLSELGVEHARDFCAGIADAILEARDEVAKPSGDEETAVRQLIEGFGDKLGAAAEGPISAPEKLFATMGGLGDRRHDEEAAEYNSEYAGRKFSVFGQKPDDFPEPPQKAAGGDG